MTHLLRLAFLATKGYPGFRAKFQQTNLIAIANKASETLTNTFETCTVLVYQDHTIKTFFSSNGRLKLKAHIAESN